MANDSDFHLVQLNLAHFKAPLADPVMSEFVAFLEPVNQLAERSDGFVWRLTDDEGKSSSYIESPFEDTMMAINLSVWRDYDSLKNFVYNSVHSYFLRHKKNWFNMGLASKFILWYLPKGQIPTLTMARERLDHYDQHGSSLFAFDTKHMFSPTGETINL